METDKLTALLEALSEAGLEDKTDDLRKTSEGIAIQAVDPFEQFLEELAEESGIDNEDEQQICFQWVRDNFREQILNQTRPSTADGSGRETDDAPLQGDGALLLLRAKAASKQAGERGAWPAFARGTLSATLVRLHEKGATPETEVDLLLTSLRPHKSSLRSPVGELMMATRARLARQRPDDQGTGYYKTRGALADLLTEVEDETNRRRRAFLYLEVLRELTKRTDIKGNDWAEIVNTDANNLGGVLDDLGEGRLSFDAMELAVCAGAATRETKGDAPDEKAVAVLQPFFARVDTARAFAWCAILDDMANVPTAWSYWRKETSDQAPDQPRDQTLMWCVEVVSAAARAIVQSEKPRKSVVSLANAGITLNKHKAAGFRQPAQCAMALNAAGLWWALANNSGNMADALQRDVGGRCAVNLLGTLADEVRGESINMRLAGLRAAIESQKDGFSADHWLRIEAAWKKMNVLASESGDFRAMLSALLLEILPEGAWRQAWKDLSEHDGADAAGLSGFLAETVRQGLPEESGSLGDLHALLVRYSQPGDEAWLAILKRFPSSMPDWYSEFEQERDDWIARLQDKGGLPGVLAEYAERLGP